MTNTETTAVLTALVVRNSTPGTYVGRVGAKWHAVWSLDGNVNCAGVRRTSRGQSVCLATEVAEDQRCARCAGGTAPTGRQAAKAAPVQDPAEVRASQLADASQRLAEYADMLARNAANPEAVADLAPQVAKFAARVAALSA